MKTQFEGANGRSRLINALEAQAIVRHDTVVATALAEQGELIDVAAGTVLVAQGAADSDFYFILHGAFDVFVKGNRVQTRGYGDHIGEIAAFDPGQKRSATVTAIEPSVVLKLPAEVVRTLGHEHPKVLEGIVVETNKRLAQRNDREAQRNDLPMVLAVSAGEALPIVRELESLLRNDDFRFRPWDQGGVFDISSYPVPSLEQAMKEADFVLVIATPEDQTLTRGNTTPTPRDNVTFEMGMAIGTVGLDRTMIVTPSTETRMGTDLNGVTVLRYRTDRDLTEALRPIAHDLRKHIIQRGALR